MAIGAQILLMDEPFAAPDALTRARMQEELLRLWDDTQFTVLFVTHSISEAIRIGNRILLLTPHPGRARAEINCGGVDVPDAGGELLSARIQRILFDAKGADDV
jgi:NitT/TauT family transport system ATP-binding protein